MNTVDKIIKVNQLAQDLIKQGIVKSRDEAVRKAEEMLDVTIARADVVTTDNKQHIMPNNAAATSQQTSNQEGQQQQPQAASQAGEQYVQEFYNYVRQQFAVYKENIVALNNTIKTMQDEIAILKTKVNQQQRPQQAQARQDAPRVTSEDSGSSEQPAPEERQQEGGRPKGATAQPRCGKTKPEEVSIEKMFNFSGK